MPNRRRIPLVALCLMGAVVASCTELELASHTAKQVTTKTKPSVTGHYKIGTPYEIQGIWYYPKVDYDYDETGIASWYGPGFHGRKTANGEIYDQYGLTAAHRTLPLPSMVRVTNLGNGRSIVVKVNDRGPFANNRIIDMSRKSAELLGFRVQGTAKVRVEILEEESRQLAAVAQSGDRRLALAEARTQVDAAGGGVATAPTSAAVRAAPTVNVTAEALSAPAGSLQTAPAARANTRVASLPPARRVLSAPEPDGVVTQVPVGISGIYVQAGSFVRIANAERLRARLSTLGAARIASAQVGDEMYFRVRLGPMVSVGEADKLLAMLHNYGIKDARVVVD